jgi:hypothetical protein
MICPECKAAGLTSRVFPLGAMTTLMGSATYYDEHGQFHDHDPNTTTSSYECSNGHKWYSERRHTCWCGWGEDNER